jgi:putative transferase (TIGR04331 family)
MKRDYYLATTALSEIWDNNSKLLLTNPWCLMGNNNKRMLRDRDYMVLPSPWEPAALRKTALEYCHVVYEETLLQMYTILNDIHHVSFPLQYWRILIGPWLLHFISAFCDRYTRIGNALKLFPDFHTNVLPVEGCCPVSYSYDDFIKFGIDAKVTDDYYNLILYSIVLYSLCPNSVSVIEMDYKKNYNINVTRYGWKSKLFNKLKKPFENILGGHILMSNMYHLSLKDSLLLKMKFGINRMHFRDFIDFSPPEGTSLLDYYSPGLRKEIRFRSGEDKFQELLLEILPNAIPVCYLETYGYHRRKISQYIDSLKLICSSVGWSYNEEFKFFAAECVSKGARYIEFQHGGNYGTSLAVSDEKLATEKDVYFSWGWKSSDYKNVNVLPSNHLSKLRETHNMKLDNVIFAVTTAPRYDCKIVGAIGPDNISGYFKFQELFILSLRDIIKDKILYRPSKDTGWGEEEHIKRIRADIKVILNDKLVNWMKKAKLVVIDHAHTSFLESLTINVPSVFYWDHDIYSMRQEAEPYFQALRDAGILYKDPVSAARKVNEIFDDPEEWWLSDDVQDARKEFCDRFAYARKDWMDVWVKELRKFI